MKLIYKDALVAEIDNILDYTDEHWDTDYVIGAQRFADKLQNAIDTLEVKEVDLDEEIEKCIKQHNMLAVGKKDFTDIARHFFELGISANNPITATDRYRFTAEEIIINLKQIDSDYRIDLTKEIEWLRNQVKKREKYDKRYINE